ncbi:MAG TPA: ATP-binding protein, partial [Dehalococcoidia bacterium]|nr:ATP-binding protein [Dehalococcoidia bacterium]
MKPRHARALVHRIERATAEALGQGDPSPPQPTKLLVAVSGGADSSATLLALSERAQQHGWQLSAVHVDHGIAAPAIRAAFRTAVRDLTERLEVPLVECAVDVPGVAAGEGLSIETAARRERYAALSRVASQEAVAAVVTGHTIDDQAESV